MTFSSNFTEDTMGTMPFLSRAGGAGEGGKS